MGETPNTGLYTEVSKQSLVIREGESKTSVVRKSGEKELPTPKHFLQLENHFMVVVSSHDPRLQEGGNAGVSQLPDRAVPAKLLLWPLSRFSSSSPPRSSKVSSAGGLLERVLVC